MYMTGIILACATEFVWPSKSHTKNHDAKYKYFLVLNILATTKHWQPGSWCPKSKEKLEYYGFISTHWMVTADPITIKYENACINVHHTITLFANVNTEMISLSEIVKYTSWISIQHKYSIITVLGKTSNSGKYQTTWENS